MPNESEDNLAKLIHEALSKLPDLQAPETLLPRVVASIQTQAQKPWWHRPWFSWPAGWRVSSLVFTVALVVSLFSGGVLLWQHAAPTDALASLQQWLDQFALVEEVFGTLANAMGIILNAIGKLWLFLSLAIALMTYLTCVGIGTVCFRLAINKR